MIDIHIDENGSEWQLGCKPRVADPGMVLPRFSDRFPVLPRSEWKPTESRRHLVHRILDQNGTSGCVGAGVVQAFEDTAFALHGQKIKLSLGSLYGQINGQRDAGANIGDALTAMEDVGVCDEELIPSLEWQRRKWPSDWQKNAKHNRVLEAYDCPTFAEMATASQDGFMFPFGILIGNDFHVDADGWLPDYRRGGGGHCMAGIGLCRHETRKVWGIDSPNSWRATWGDNGYSIVPESYFDESPYTDGWAIRVVTMRED